jgi:two-component system, NtrC family, sensor kinase
MRKDVDTHFFAVRQVLLLGPAGGDLPALVAAALPLPRYIVHTAREPQGAVQVISRNKIEVVVYGVVDVDEAARAVDLMKAADPDVEVVLVVDEGRIAALPPTVFSFADLVSRPVGPTELACRVERAREHRFLLRAEERRKRAEARVTAIVQAVPTGIVSIDAEATIHDWNPAASRIFGWPQATALGRHFWQLVTPEADRAACTDAEGKAVLGKTFELVARHQSGRLFPVALSLAALPLADRPLTAVMIEDRTEARRLEVDLRQAQRLEAVGQLAAGLAHEINTPCQYIGTSAAAVTASLSDVGQLLGRYSELLRAADSGAIDDELVAAVARAEQETDLEFVLTQTPRQLAAIEEGAQRIAGIVQALGDFTRAQWAQEAASLDVNRSLQSILTVLDHEVKAVAELVVDAQPLPPIFARGGEVNQALFNIVRNAIEAIARRHSAGGAGKGSLVVRTRAEPDAVVVAIADSGDGIPEAIRGRIFDPFFTTKEVGRGTGQGLSVAWTAIVERHGGTLSFETDPARGTTFHVRLPLKPRKNVPVQRGD